MSSGYRRGEIAHYAGAFLREYDGDVDGQLYRVEKGRIQILKHQIEERGGLKSLIPDFDETLHALDSLDVLFVPSGRTDKRGIPYATNLRLKNDYSSS